MARRLCETCHEPLEVVRSGKRPAVLKDLCAACNVVSDHMAEVVEFPRSSADRNELDDAS